MEPSKASWHRLTLVVMVVQTILQAIAVILAVV